MFYHNPISCNLLTILHIEFQLSLRPPGLEMMEQLCPPILLLVLEEDFHLPDHLQLVFQDIRVQLILGHKMSVDAEVCQAVEDPVH